MVGRVPGVGNGVVCLRRRRGTAFCAAPYRGADRSRAGGRADGEDALRRGARGERGESGIQDPGANQPHLCQGRRPRAKRAVGGPIGRRGLQVGRGSRANPVRPVEPRGGADGAAAREQKPGWERLRQGIGGIEASGSAVEDEPQQTGLHPPLCSGQRSGAERELRAVGDGGRRDAGGGADGVGTL